MKFNEDSKVKLPAILYHTQFMIFLNNMEYDDNEIESWQGAYHAASSYYKPVFNYFKEEIGFNFNQVLKPLDTGLEDFLLKATNLGKLKNKTYDDVILRMQQLGYIVDKNTITKNGSLKGISYKENKSSHKWIVYPKSLSQHL